MPLSMAVPGEVNYIKRIGGKEDIRRFLGGALPARHGWFARASLRESVE